MTTLTAPKLSRAEQSAQRKVLILRAALCESSEKGFSSSRMDDIAKLAGVARGTLYLHFKDKEALFSALIEQLLSPMVQQIEAPLPAGESIRTHLEKFLQTLLAKLTHSPEASILRLLITEGFRFPNLTKLYYETIVHRGLKGIEKLLLQAVKNGEMKHKALPTSPQLGVSPFITAIIWKMLFEPYHPLDLQAMLATHLDLIFSEPLKAVSLVIKEDHP